MFGCQVLMKLRKNIASCSDQKKAFDSLARKRNWQVLRSYSIPEKFVRIIKNWHNNIESAVIYDKKISDWSKLQPV